MTEEKEQYELMLLFSGELKNEGLAKELGKIKDFLGSIGADIVLEDDWGRKRLAYRIKGNDEGSYVILYFLGIPKNNKELEECIGLEKNILRYLLVKTPDRLEPKKKELEMPVRWRPLKDDEDDKSGENKEKSDAKNFRSEKSADKMRETSKKASPKIKKEAPREMSETEMKTPVLEGKDVVVKDAESEASAPTEAKPESAPTFEEPTSSAEEETSQTKEMKKEEEKETEKPEREENDEPEESGEPSTLESIDEKLKNIIDNPDITL